MQKQLQEIVNNQVFSWFLRAGRPCRKKAPKMTSRRLSGTLPGTLWDPPGTPWEAQDDPTEAPRAIQDGPRSRPEYSKRAPGSTFGDPWRPRGRLEASREPFWTHFGRILKQFSSHSSVPGAHLPGFPGTCFSHVRFLCSSFSVRPLLRCSPSLCFARWPESATRAARDSTGRHDRKDGTEDDRKA